MKFEGKTFKIKLEDDSIIFEGSIRLWDPHEYAELKDTLLTMYEVHKTKNIRLNMEGLQYLNSSGISMLCKFILRVKHLNTGSIEVIGNKSIPWQKKSFTNLQKLWGDIDVAFV